MVQSVAVVSIVYSFFCSRGPLRTRMLKKQSLFQTVAALTSSLQQRAQFRTGKRGLIHNL